MNLFNVVLTSFLVLTPISINESQVIVKPLIVVEAPTSPVVKTFDTEVHRLALKYKQNETLARAIIKCEGKMYKDRGNNKNYTKEGVWWSSDIGWWQINDFYHKDSALKMGLDIYNEWDNLEYGFSLMSREGTTPWNASKYCWAPITKT